MPSDASASCRHSRRVSRLSTSPHPRTLTQPAYTSAQPICDLDLAFTKDPKFRQYRAECDEVLLQFEKAEEWADLIRYLQRLQRTLNKFAQLPVVPDKVLVAKRLYQCLNPALPSGVHLKTLETIELIFSRIGEKRLARDLCTRDQRPEKPPGTTMNP